MSSRILNSADLQDLIGQILKTGNKVRFEARGRSMQPFIYEGDILEVAPAASRDFRVGDVLLVQTGDGGLLAHRVIKTRRRDKVAFFIKGDSCAGPDGWFGYENILGRVVAIEHAGKKIEWTSNAQRWRSMIWVFIVPWIPKFSWLPRRIRQSIKKWILGGIMPGT